MNVEDIDFTSPSWHGIKAFCQDRIEALKEQCLSELDPVQTARVRARVAAYREILGLEQIVEVDPDV